MTELLDFLTAVSWPLAAVAIVFLFRRPISRYIDRATTIAILGNSVTAEPMNADHIAFWTESNRPRIVMILQSHRDEDGENDETSEPLEAADLTPAVEEEEDEAEPREAA